MPLKELPAGQVATEQELPLEELPAGGQQAAMASGDAAQLPAGSADAALALTAQPRLAGAPEERRLANDGSTYTKSEFLQWYGDAGERQWAAADGLTDDAAEPERTVGGQAQLQLQLQAGLMPEHAIAAQQAEAARGAPRSLHTLARDAPNAINKNPTRSTVNLDDCFPWVEYVAAHKQSAEIIGPGITHAQAVFLPGTSDKNRGGAPRLDFCFYRTDGTVCRVHPGRRPKEDAKLVFEHSQ